MTLTAMPKYEVYKDSGVEWLGKIPHDWTLISLNRTVVGCVNGLWGNEPNGVNDIVVLRVADFERNKLKINDQKLTVRSIPLKDRYGRLLKNGDLLIEKSGGGDKTLVGCVVLFDKAYDAITSNFVAKMTPKDNFDARFLCYLFSAFYSSNVNYRSIKQTTGIQNLDSGAYLSEVAAFPLLPTQTAIANFLDTKTAQIDEAIAIKEQQIALLNERKQILIQQAVTQGLDPTVPMKDSGVEWIGKIPEHWDIRKLRYLGQTQNGISASAEYFGSGYSFVNYSDVYKNRQLPVIVSGLANSSEYEQILYSVQEGDVFFTRTSETIEEIGFASICFETIPHATFSGFLIRFRPVRNLITKEYAKYYFNAPMLRNYFVKEMNLVTRASLSQELLKDLPVIIAPTTEQLEIFSYLEGISKKFDAAIDIAFSEIEKLKEYKTTLINSAVTGKIKVV